MKIAYLAIIDVTSNYGVPKKIHYQLEGWRKAGAVCEFFGVASDAESQNRLLDGQIIQRAKKKYALTQWVSDRRAFAKLVEAIVSWQPDLVYLRWGYPKPEFLEIAHTFPTVIEVNGDVIRTAKVSASNRRFLGRFLGIYVRMTAPALWKRAAAFVAVTNEVAQLGYIKKWKKPIGVFPNSVNFSEYSICPYLSDQNALPRIVFIGNVSHWHGLDKLINLARQTVGKLEFDVIGCNEAPEYACSNVYFHGYLSRDEYVRVFSRATVGIDGLALYRKDMNEACALKIREYLACGLPIILAAEDTALIGVQRDWLLRIGNFEENVSDHIKEIVDFAYRCRGIRVSHDESKEYIAASYVEERRFQFLSSLL